MKTSTLRRFLAVHTWVGIVAGFFLFMAFYCGAISVFRTELHRWERPAERVGAIEPLARADALLAAMRTQHPEADTFGFQPAGKEKTISVIHWQENSAEDGQQGADHDLVLAADGSLAERSEPSVLADFIYRLHYSAGIPGPWGMYLFGLFSVLYGMALVSGVIVFLPVLAKDLFALRVGHNLKRLWQDAHNVIGTLSLPFHMLYAWTGAILGLGFLLLAPLQYLVYDGKLLPLLQPDFELAAEVRPSGVAAQTLPVSELLARAVRAAPGIEPTYLSFHHAGDRAGYVEVYGDWRGQSVMHNAGVVLSTADGAVQRVVVPDNASPGTVMLRGLYALHFAGYGGVLLKWLYFVLGLAGAFLFYTGNLLWIEARRKRRQSLQTASSLWMARATVGVCIGCIVGVSACFLANKLLPAGLEARGSWEERIYFFSFAGCIIWSALRRPVQAAHELLLLAAALTLALPIANALLTGDHLIASALNGDGVLFAVDAVAVLAAWAFWRMARATARRGIDGDPNSVWALPLPMPNHAAPP
jgi:uncharacterized iron-regulated membrane protein